MECPPECNQQALQVLSDFPEMLTVSCNIDHALVRCIRRENAHATWVCPGTRRPGADSQLLVEKRGDRSAVAMVKEGEFFF
jgi:hypothetical protein